MIGPYDYDYDTIYVYDCCSFICEPTYIMIRHEPFIYDPQLTTHTSAGHTNVPFRRARDNVG